MPTRPTDTALSAFSEYTKTLIILFNSTTDRDYKFQYLTELLSYFIESPLFLFSPTTDGLRQMAKLKCRQFRLAAEEYDSPFTQPLLKVLNRMERMLSLVSI
jgi:hypothetical protein